MAKKRFKTPRTGLIGPTLGLTLGSQITEKIGGPIATQGQTAFKRTSEYLPTIGTLKGAQLVLKQFNKIKKKTSPW